MKRIVFWMVALLLMSGVAMAQGNRQGGRQQMDPKTRAQRMTERMVKEYSLNEDQKQQLLDVNLAWVEKMAANQGRHSKDDKAARMTKEEREKKAMECMQQVGLKGYENQMVGQLSGGMQQRVGLARALANNPEVLLMDEAFSALDPLIRVQMQDELLTLQSKMKKTIVFITHDLNEAIKLGDRIAIMKDGEIVQTGTSEEILTEPANAYVERFVENVDRSKIITASSIMADKPLVARLKKEGPEVLIRKMRERNLTVLPVVDAGNILVGEVRLNDLLKLRKEQIRSIDTVVHHEVHSVLSDTILEDILPLMTRTNSPIWVVNENREFQGVVPLSSLIIEVTGKNKEEINEIIQNAIEL